MNIGNERIGDIFRVLGSRQHRTPLESTNTPFMYRSTWHCGCAVDYIDAEVGPFQWFRCAGHGHSAESATHLAALNWSDRIGSLNS